MTINKSGESIEYNGVRYTIGDRITANKNSDYDGATGIIIEISDEEDGVDIFCDLEKPTDEEVINNITHRFKHYHGDEETFDDINFDSVVMSPDEIDIVKAKPEIATELITEEIEKKFESHPFGSQGGKGLDAEVIVKYFNPYGAGTWLITEAEKQEDGDWMLFGYCHIFEWEWGTVMLSELKNTKVNVMGYKLFLERDLYSKGTVKETM